MFESPFVASPKSFSSAELSQASKAVPEPTRAAEGGVPRRWEPRQWAIPLTFAFALGHVGPGLS